LKRGRTVGANITLATHAGAAMTMSGIVNAEDKIVAPGRINGEVHVILGNNKETVFWKNAKGETTNDYEEAARNPRRANKIFPHLKVEDDISGRLTKSFTSVKIKDKGKTIKTDTEALKKVNDWVNKNAPKEKTYEDV
jgi:hypothetical protein